MQIITSLIENTVDEYIYEENRMLMSEQAENKRTNEMFMLLSIILVSGIVIIALIVSAFAPEGGV